MIFPRKGTGISEIATKLWLYQRYQRDSLLIDKIAYNAIC
jgi:hypothetical protein